MVHVARYVFAYCRVQDRAAVYGQHTSKLRTKINLHPDWSAGLVPKSLPKGRLIRMRIVIFRSEYLKQDANAAYVWYVVYVVYVVYVWLWEYTTVLACSTVLGPVCVVRLALWCIPDVEISSLDHASGSATGARSRLSIR